MGANQSGSGQGNSGELAPGSQQGGILVVNPTPGQRQAEASIVLPRRVPSIMSPEGHHIDPMRHKPNKHQLNPELWRDLVVVVNEFTKSRSELVAQRQAFLQDKISQVDEHVQEFSDSYANGKHKALGRLQEDCRKMDDINKLLQKCTIQSELCVSMLNKLNFLLPDEQKLEELDT